MPLYEYECKKCHNRFEKIQSFSAPEEKICPKCGGEVERLISSPTVQFKGTGWYVTDYARKSTGTNVSKSESSESGEGAKNSKTAESKTESKATESKTESKPTGGSSSENK